MENLLLEKQLKAYDGWKTDMIRTIRTYHAWAKKHRLSTEESEKRIQESLSALYSDRLTIAFVAEFSRGKTELINAIFFAEYGRRLLPSAAGRTTMCPTELFYDKQADQAYVRLLPIETRLQDLGIRELKKKPALWVTYPLNLDSPGQVEDCLKEVVQTRKVSQEEAVRLGMFDPEQYAHEKGRPDIIEIPKWRHALISFPHPLLKQGLSILDTPGLNALGSEPELTLNMLPAAQAVLFVLGADTGVTRSDLEMWQNHIQGFHNKRKRGLIVVLNKIDTLWDELQNEKSLTKALNKQCKSVAKILGVEQAAIFPVSAHKGLIGKIKKDDKLLKQSALENLENYLSGDIVNTRREIVQETVTADIDHMVENTRAIVTTRLKGIKDQLNELRQLSGKSQDMIEQMMDKTRQEQAEYMRNVNSFQASRKVLKDQAKTLQTSLDMKRLERSISASYNSMADNWTTLGLKTNMRALFDDMRSNMQTVVEQSEQARKLIRSIYRRFQLDHNFTAIQPKMFSIMRYRVELELLHQEAEIFRKSTVTTMTEKHFVVKRFFVAMVSRARDIFFQAKQEVDIWLKSALEPLVFQIREHKEQMERRLLDLQKVSRSKDTLELRVHELEQQYNSVAKQLTMLRNIHNELNSSVPLDEEQRPRPRLVASNGKPK